MITAAMSAVMIHMAVLLFGLAGLFGKLIELNPVQIVFGRTEIDLRSLEQLLDPSQTRAVGRAIYLASQRLLRDQHSLTEVLDALDSLLDEQGLDTLAPEGRPGQHPGALARPRRHEIAGAINRMRSLRLGY